MVKLTRVQFETRAVFEEIPYYKFKSLWSGDASQEVFSFIVVHGVEWFIIKVKVVVYRVQTPWQRMFNRLHLSPAAVDPTLDLCTRYPLGLGGLRQCRIRSLPDTSTHDQYWESNPRLSDLESNTLNHLTTCSYITFTQWCGITSLTAQCIEVSCSFTLTEAASTPNAPIADLSEPPQRCEGHTAITVTFFAVQTPIKICVA